MLLAVRLFEELILRVGLDNRPEFLMNLQECFIELVCFFCLFHLSFQGRQDHPEGFGSVLELEAFSGCFASEEGKESGLAFDRPVFVYFLETDFRRKSFQSLIRI